MITKTQIEALIAIINGHASLDALQRKRHCSKSFASRLVGELAEQGFVQVLKRKRGNRISLAATAHARYFQEMVLKYPYRPYAKFLAGKNLELLLALAHAPKCINVLSMMLNVQPRMVRTRLRQLAAFGLIQRQGPSYNLGGECGELRTFLQALRYYFPSTDLVLWKFGNETLIKTRGLSGVQDKLTGFSRYEAYGVSVHTVGHLVYTGPAKLTVDLVFIHSLFEVDDIRTRALALTLFMKQRLYRRLPRLTSMAEKFDHLHILTEIVEHYTTLKNNNRFGGEAEAVVKEACRQFALYGVENL